MPLAPSRHADPVAAAPGQTPCRTIGALSASSSVPATSRRCARVTASRVPLAARHVCFAPRGSCLLAEQGDGVGWRGRRRTREDGRDATQVLALQVAARPGDRAAGLELAPDRGAQRGEELGQPVNAWSVALTLTLGVEQARRARRRSTARPSTPVCSASTRLRRLKSGLKPVASVCPTRRQDSRRPCRAGARA